VFSSIDRNGRYAFGKQPVMAQWNLTRLAEALLPLIDADDTDRAIRLATDVINGFTRGTDRIDLSALDADTTSFGSDDAFSFIGSAGFTGAGQLRLQSLGGANAVLVEADVNGDGQADLQIFVNLTTSLGASDFIM
jgi:hypothetical protein